LTQFFETNPQLVTNIIDFPKTYNINDTVFIEVEVTHDADIIADANVYSSILTPDNFKNEITLSYNSSKLVYEGFFISSIGGNYYVTVNADRYRFSDGSDTKIAKTFV